MRSSDRPVRPLGRSGIRPRGWGRAFLWGVVVVNAVLGLGLLVVALGQLLGPAADRTWSPTTSVVVAVGALAWAGFGAIGFHRNYLRVPPRDGRRASLAETDGSPAVVVAWRTTYLRQPLLLTAVVVVVLVGLAVVLRTDGNAGWWLPGAVAVPVLVLLPDALLRAVRPGRLVLSPRGIGVTGGDGDAWLDWDDVRGIGFEDVNQWTVLRVVGVDGAPSWRFRPRRTVVRAVVPAGPWIDIPGPALPIDAGALIEAIAHYRRNSSARVELATEQGRRRVAGLG